MTTDPQTLSSESISTDELLEGTTPLNLAEEIEMVIASMAQDQKVMVGESETGHLWKFNYGSVEVFVQLTERTDEASLNVWSPVLNLPAKDEPKLMRQLLEMNWLSTFESRFAIFNNQVVVLASRSVADLNPGEISRSITVVATTADNNDDTLKAEFGQ